MNAVHDFVFASLIHISSSKRNIDQDLKWILNKLLIHCHPIVVLLTLLVPLGAHTALKFKTNVQSIIYV